VEKASRFYEKAMENKKTTDPQHWNGWGIVLLKLAEITNEKRNVEAAVAKFEQALMLYSSRNGDDDLDPDLLYNYGCALDFLGDFYEEACYYEKAVQALTKVLQIDSEYTAARYNLALALSHLGEQTADVECFHQAIDQFQMLLTVDREDGMVWSEYGLTLLNLAQLVHDAALPDKSLQYYEDAADKLLCAVSLGCLQASYYLACLFSLLRRFDDAMFYIERADSQDALPPIDEVMRDDWLESLRQTTAFKIWLERRDVP
jgi:tetratricopeptide (TPR) repeat protein